MIPASATIWMLGSITVIRVVAVLLAMILYRYNIESAVVLKL